MADHPLRARLAALVATYRDIAFARQHDVTYGRIADDLEALLREPPAAAATEDERMIEQFCVDLNDAHDEIVRLQGGNPQQYDWPEWSGPAHSIRWAEHRLGKPLSKTAARAAAPEEK